ncbi:MAG: SDR family NAD(P)-dependent oxidoreductase [Rhizobiaceae bacterium]|nr:SDR family NAD(P)-dependent oxidoreductase [Rhizobiaceae bacterium]
MVDALSNWQPKRCVVVGASGGIGAGFVEHLLARDSVEQVYGFARSSTVSAESDRFTTGRLDYADVGSIKAAADRVKQDGPVDLVIVATGLLHAEDGFGPEKSMRQLDPEALSRAYLVNAIGPIMVAKHFLPLLTKDRKSVFAALSARVGSISDNRIGGWYGYRAAKAGLNQMLRTASIEHQRRWPHSVIIGLHPGTVDTGLSKPFQRNVADGKLFTAQHSTGQMLNVIDRVTEADSGNIFAYDGSQVPA